jgi:N-ethylmaleimide reductase
MTAYPTLFSQLSLGRLTLRNRAVMSPMTRSRAIGNVPNDLMATYYAQRAGAGLIVTEGTAPSPNGLGYPRIPGVYSAEQAAGWRKVTDAVHAEGGAIFIQLMHVGRIGHPLNLPEGAELVAPSAITAAGQMYTDQEGPQPHPTPRAMTERDIEQAIGEFVHAAKTGIEAGFDGVELHGANGYLIDQFINTKTNQRTDGWGGSAEKRNRFAIEVARQTANAIGADRTGLRLSPYGVFNDLEVFDGIDDQYRALAGELGRLGLTYIHIADMSSMGAAAVPDAIKATIRDAFGGTIILSGGYDAATAEAHLAEGRGHLVAFGRPFLANPDLLERFESGAELNPPQHSTFYTPGPEGYTDYPRRSV